jgi:polyhydroxybutyrate depolymerase
MQLKRSRPSLMPLLLCLCVVGLALFGRGQHAAATDLQPVGQQPPAVAITNAAHAGHKSSGCASANRTRAGGTAQESLASGGLTRNYRLHVPPGRGSTDALPVVLLFHGRGGNAADIERDSGLLPLADREGFLLVSPDGTGSPAGWGAGASLATWPVNDVQFAKDLLARLEQEQCVDTSRVYAVGHSNGAFMAARLACAMPGTIAAVVPVAGAYVPPEGCSRPVPVLSFHGTGDTIVPYGGGLVRDVYMYRGVQAELTTWSKANGCTPGPSNVKLTDALSLLQWQGCKAPVELVVTSGGNHNWPQLSDLARADGNISTADVIWGFLQDKYSS